MTLEDFTPLPPIEVFNFDPPRRHPVLSLLQKPTALLAIVVLLPLVALIGAFSLACEFDLLLHRLHRRLCRSRQRARPA